MEKMVSSSKATNDTPKATPPTPSKVPEMFREFVGVTVKLGKGHNTFAKECPILPYNRKKRRDWFLG